MTLGEGIQQLYVFLAFVALGVISSVVYLFATAFFKGKLASAIFDALFGVSFVFALWKLNVRANNGEFRLFVFVALFFGIFIATVTCKSTLDKAAAVVYNLTTSHKAAKNGKTVLQKELGNIDDSGADGAGVSALYAADNSHAVDQFEAKSRKADGTGKGGRTRRSGKARTFGVPQNR